MLKQFQGKEGERRRLEIFKNSDIKFRPKLAQKLAQIVELNEYEKGQELFVQGQTATGYLYFILSGKIDLLSSNGTLITTRGPGQVLGEFPFIEPSLPHTVTACCQERTIVAKVSEKQFQLITGDNPVLWKNIARFLVGRLNTTSNQFIYGSKGSRVFIGHGHSELWRELKDFIVDDLHLEWDEFNREPTAGKSITQRLSEMLNNAALAFLILTAEDEQLGKFRARMNVIHEAGLFQGRLGFEKAIILIERGCEEFSNIYGLCTIHFDKGNIKDIFEKIKEITRREGLLK